MDATAKLGRPGNMATATIDTTRRRRRPNWLADHTAAELIRLRRPAFVRGGFGIIAGFTALISIFVFTTAGDDEGGFGPAASAAADELSEVGGFVASLGTISNLVGIVFLALWAMAAATDYDSGLVRILAQAEPRRGRLLAGKVGALALFTVAGTLLATVVAAAVAYPLAGITDVSSAAWGTNWIGEFLSAWLYLTVASLAWGAVGLAIAVGTRSSGVAIAAGIGYLMVVENLLRIVAEDIVDYFPGSTLTAVASGGSDALSAGAAMALAVGYIALALLVAHVTFGRREITS